MSRRKHHTRAIKANIQEPSRSIGQDLTPGRAPAEGPAIVGMSPSHEWWEHHTADLDPVEGPEMVESTETEGPAKK